MTATTTDNRYTLRAPCRNCPFRTDLPVYLRAGRAKEIADGLRSGGEFACHKTTVSVEDDEGETERIDMPGTSRFCAGALAVMENDGAPNQMMRIAEGLGMYSADTLTPEAKAAVYPSLTEWVRAHQDIPTVTDDDGEVLEFEHCGVVEGDCEDPAGFGGPYGAQANDDEPTCNPLEDVCEGCSRTACASCRSEQWDEDGQWCVACHNPGQWN